MTNTEQKEGPQLDLAAEETVTPKGPGIGALLKNEREKLGLNFEQIIQVTRLRKHFIEALENEAWDKLPPPVFVRGFIRSYAQALGLDQEKALTLYESLTPTPSSPPISFKKPSKGKKWLLYVIGFLIVVAVLMAIYLWMGNSPSRIIPPGDMVEKAVESEKGEGDVPQSQTEGAAGDAGGPPDLNAAAVEQPRDADRDVLPPAAEKENSIAPEGTSEGQGESITEQTADGNREETIQAEVVASQAEEGQTQVETRPEGIMSESASGSLALTGIVKTRTWIRICVDDQDPKEYIFQPGSRPQWRADNGFYVLIGNAAGMDFSFKGETIENLGELGRVKRLRLPEDFKGTKCED